MNRSRHWCTYIHHVNVLLEFINVVIYSVCIKYRSAEVHVALALKMTSSFIFYIYAFAIIVLTINIFLQQVLLTLFYMASWKLYPEVTIFIIWNSEIIERVTCKFKDSIYLFGSLSLFSLRTLSMLKPWKFLSMCDYKIFSTYQFVVIFLFNEYENNV